MAKRNGDPEILDLTNAAQLLETHWQAVIAEVNADPEVNFVADITLRQAIQVSVNHRQVAYRFCLPIQLLGKLTNPMLDCLRLQKRKGDPTKIPSLYLPSPAPH
jgi:carbohydrate-binding DOMON domain-containing protein